MYLNTARLTGIWYLILAISGMLGFLIYQPQIFIPNNPQQTLNNLINQETTARIRLILEFVIIISQALSAVWFYKLFKPINEWGAFTLAIWGTMNAAIILVSAIAMSSAIDIANTVTTSLQGKTDMIQLLSQIMTNAWEVGSLFFGLWLLPMGYIILASKRMPIWLGRILIIGGMGYIISAFFNYFGIKHSLLELLVIPATIGEFWIIGYLLIYGLRPSNK
ncbi:MAG: DUF4386 domain-containing protein [Sediminibacterium sp.]|nr:DUF4386 domain-containing protein [Sediminibacterium sp.]